MRKDKTKQFLNGSQDLGDFQKSTLKNSVNTDFIEAYKKVVKQLNAEKTLDFNPFEKIESYKKKRFSIAKRFAPYAATILLIVCLFVFINKQQQNSHFQSPTNTELTKIQQNTEFAMLHFSKELNACLAKFDDAKKMEQPVYDIKSLKSIKIESNNPFKNFKFK